MMNKHGGRLRLAIRHWFWPLPAADEEDARAVGVALNHLGYFSPDRRTGFIAARPEGVLFEGLRKFQRDHGIFPSGRIAPGDETEGALNDALARNAQSGRFYVWRTVGDGKVRGAHAAREGRLFRWDETLDGGHPGEDFNCRCWAEPYLVGYQAPSQNKCEEAQIAYINANAAFMIVTQNLNKAENELASLNKQLEKIYALIKKEKSDKAKARNKGGATGAVIGSILGIPAGPGGIAEIAAVGLGTGAKIGILIEEAGDIIRGQKTDYSLDVQKHDLEKSIENKKKEITDLKLNLSVKKSEFESAKLTWLKCMTGQ